jgi:hypothetical protein
VRVRALVPAPDWAYCGKVASQAADEALRGLFAEAEQTVVGGHGSARGADAAPTHHA